MKWVRDLTGRFAQRPHYELDELDAECEALIEAFLRTQRGEVAYPIATDDLLILIERHTSDLDPYADLSCEGEGVEGVTDFFTDCKPRVRIAAALSEQNWRENRLRTTLTHELGHVRFHAFLGTMGRSLPLPLFADAGPEPPARCKRETILGAGTADWMEWQAGYACGAYLMPRTPLRLLVADFHLTQGTMGTLAVRTPAGRLLIQSVCTRFQVSADAARVRLLKRGYLTETAPFGQLLMPSIR